jgi:catechol 2,3-dioxygenase-like lactoylglutathione lyase family enzyme
MTLAIHHIAINATDTAAIARTYAQSAGFRSISSFAGAEWIAAPTAYLALFTADEVIPPRDQRVCDQGIGHFCIQSGAGKTTWDALTDAGIRFNAEPAPLGTGVLYAYGRDLESNLIELECVPNESTETPPWLAHVAMVSADLDRLAEFYARLIGRDPHREGTFAHPSMPQISGLDDVKVSAKWIMADNLIFEMWHYHIPETLPAPAPLEGARGYRHVGFCCRDLATEIDRLADHGITVSNTDIMGNIPAIFGVDPDGNRFIILEAPSPGQPLSLHNLARPDMVSDRLRNLLHA